MLSGRAEMPDWLIGFNVALAAASPTWTDIVQAIAAVFAAAGVIGGFIYSGLQIRKGRLEQARTVELQTAQRALSLMQLVIEITSIMVERPHLAPYIYDGKDPPKKGRHLKGRDLHDEVLAYGRLFMSFGEAVGWQIHTHQMDPDAVEAWRDYFTDLHKNSPTVRCAVKSNEKLLAEETLDLFGADRAK